MVRCVRPERVRVLAVEGVECVDRMPMSALDEGSVSYRITGRDGLSDDIGKTLGGENKGEE